MLTPDFRTYAQLLHEAQNLLVIDPNTLLLKEEKLKLPVSVLAGVVGLLLRVIFSPKSMSYALVGHNHFKVGYAVQEVISEARKHGIKAPRLYAVEHLITK